MTQFREVVVNHVQVHGPLSTSDHAALTLILEKKMPLNGAITAKYKEHKRVNPHDVDDWEFAMRRFFSQVNAVRQLQLHAAVFGDWVFGDPTLRDKIHMGCLSRQTPKPY